MCATFVQAIQLCMSYELLDQTFTSEPSDTQTYISVISHNYINPGYGLSLVDTLWNASPYRQPLEQEGNPMT